MSDEKDEPATAPTYYSCDSFHPTETEYALIASRVSEVINSMPDESVASSDERLVLDEKRPGIELIEFVGGPGYDDEQLLVENGLGNGLRIQILNEDMDCWASFYIHDPATAELIAAKLIEWSKRIGDPPDAEARSILEKHKAPPP